MPAQGTVARNLSFENVGVYTVKGAHPQGFIHNISLQKAVVAGFRQNTAVKPVDAHAVQFPYRGGWSCRVGFQVQLVAGAHHSRISFGVIPGKTLAVVLAEFQRITLVSGVVPNPVAAQNATVVRKGQVKSVVEHREREDHGITNWLFRVHGNALVRVEQNGWGSFGLAPRPVKRQRNAVVQLQHSSVPQRVLSQR